MTIEITSLGKANVIKVGGRMDAESRSQFDAACDRCLEDGAMHVVLDFGDLQYISSAGLSSVVRLAKQLNGLGGSVFLCGVKGLVREVFEVTNLLSIFRVFDSPEAACQSL